MPGKILCLGIYGDGMFLSVSHAGKPKASAYISGNFIKDGVLTEPQGFKSALTRFLTEHAVRPSCAVLFIKTSQSMSRLLEFPKMDKRELLYFRENNFNEFFPVSIEGYAGGSSVVYSDSKNIVLYACAVPEGIVSAYAEALNKLKIELRFAYTFQNLLINALPGGKSSISVLENNNKTNIILFDETKPKVIRDLPFSSDTFTGDFDKILEMYQLAAAEDVYLLGERYKPFVPYLSGKGGNEIHGETEILNKTLSQIHNKRAVNILPYRHKLKVRIKKAVKSSVAHMAAFFLPAILLVTMMSQTKLSVISRISVLYSEIGNEVFAESEKALKDYSDLVVHSQEITRLYSPIVAYDTLALIFSCLPYNVRLTEVTAETRVRQINVSGAAGSDEELLTLIDCLLDLGFHNPELTDLNYENSNYSFNLTFLY